MRCSFVIALWVCLSGILAAQPVPRAAVMNVHTGKTTALCNPVDSTWSQLDPKTGEPKVVFSIPFEARSLQRVGEAFYCIGKSPIRLEVDQERYSYPLYRSTTGRDWKEFGRLSATWRGNIRVFFLDERRLVALTMVDGFEKSGRKSKMALMTLDSEGETRVDELVDSGIPASCRMGLPMMVQCAPIPDGWVMAQRLTGIVHTFRLRGEKVVVDVTRLYPSVTEQLKQNRPIYGPVYGIQAMPDGQVLFATTTEKAMQDAGVATRKLMEGSTENLAEYFELAKKQTEGLDPKLANDLLAERMKTFSGKDVRLVTDLICKAFAELLWWEFDPTQRRFRRVDPPGAPSVLRGMEEVVNLQFYYLPSGRLLVKTKAR